MIRLGEKQTLTVVKRVEFGVYLAEDQREEQRVLLPGRQENRWHHRCRLGAGKYHPRSPGPARLATTHFP